MLPREKISPAAAEKMKAFHRDTVREVEGALAEHRVVVVGMAWNPHVRRARRALRAAGVPHHYLEYGSYVSGWRKRLAIKLWSGWPTFPQVFVDGILIGGADHTEAAIARGEIAPRADREKAAVAVA